MSVSKRDVVRYAAIAAGTVVLSEFAEEEKRVHRFWVRPWIKVRDNEEQNTILKLYRELLEVRIAEGPGPGRQRTCLLLVS